MESSNLHPSSEPSLPSKPTATSEPTVLSTPSNLSEPAVSSKPQIISEPKNKSIPAVESALSKQPDPAFWKGRRVFITGHTGFKGSWLSLWLKALGAEVTGYALSPPTKPNLFEQARVAEGINSLEGDVRDYLKLSTALAKHQPEVVLHLAAQTVVRRSYEDPIETYSTNVMGTVNLLEALRQIWWPCAVVCVTSDKCYTNREMIWGYREDEPMGGRDPYSNSKGCAELVIHAMRESFFPAEETGKRAIAIASARAGNVIGGGDWTRDQLIPDLLRAFLGSKPCLIRSPGAIRPWQFVLEPLRGYLLLSEALTRDPDRFASGWNFGPLDSDAKPVEWIADRLVKLWGEGAAWTRDGATHPHEDHYLKLDAAKAGMYLGWRPLLPLSEALEWIVEWYLSFQAGDDLRPVVERQIEDYQRLSTFQK